MRLLIQRVKEASVSIEGRLVAHIGVGLLAFVGFGRHDEDSQSRDATMNMLSQKMLGLRIFPSPHEPDGKLQCSVEEYGGALLLVPQFTLYADCRKGRRPSFSHAGHPIWAKPRYEQFVQHVDETTQCAVYTGIFGADMAVQLCNWGPVTLFLDSEELFS